jgi:sucrose-6-phosphate hydrolase SacC (GH32 family)
VKEIETLYARTERFEHLSAKSVNTELSKLNLELVDMSVEFAPSESFVIDIRGLEIHYDVTSQEFVFTNTARVKGESAAWRKTAPYRDRGIRRIPAPAVDGRVTLRALVDRASLELFVNDGQAAASFVVVPEPEHRRISIEGNADLKIVSLVVNELESIWPADLASRNVSEVGKENLTIEKLE